MYVIYAEKPDIGTKIAAALDAVHLKNGTDVRFEDIDKYISQIKKQRTEDGYLKIRYKGEDVIVTWGIGHLCTLKDAVDYNPDYKKWRNLPVPFFPDKWELKPIKESKSQLDRVKKCVKGADYIICATDDDREGELLFAYVYEYLNLKIPYKYRLKAATQTKKGYLDAMDKLIDARLVKGTEMAGRARSIADAAIGWNCTAQLTIKVNNGELYNLGRCITTVLNMLVERELAIRNFKPEDYFVIDAVFNKDGVDFKGELTAGRFKTRPEAGAVLRKITGKDGVIKDIKSTVTTKEVPSLYSLSLLQMAANEKYGMSLDNTLKTTQSLYEKGYVPYPRTDSCYLTEDMEPVVDSVFNVLESMPEYKPLIAGKSRVINKKKNFFDNKKVESHYAIIPTHVKPVNLTDPEKKVYDLIARSVIRMLYKEAEIEKTTVLIDVDGVEFKATGSSIKDEGWMQVTGLPKEKFLPKLSVSDTVSGTYVPLAKKTEPPKRYTDSTILVAMKSAGKTIEDKNLRDFMTNNKIQGVGRPSTQAAIIERLIALKLCRREKKNIIPTDKGIDLIKIIPFDDIKSAELTAKWEQRMSDIESGKENFDDFVRDIKKLTTDWCNKIINMNMQGVKIMSNGNGNGNGAQILTGVKCPECGGDILKWDWGYGCSEYKNKNCRFSIYKEICKRKMSDAEVKKLINDRVIGPLDGFKGKYGDFPAQLELVKNEDGILSVSFVKKEKSESSAPKKTEYTCLECGKPLNEFDWGFSCSRYKEGCKFAVGKKAYGKELTKEEIEELIFDGETSHTVKDLEFNGRMFDAVLIISEGRVKAKKTSRGE